MTPRELFESRFPVPDGVEYDQLRNDYVPIYRATTNASLFSEWNGKAIRQTNLWIGFQAGYEAGREGK